VRNNREKFKDRKLLDEILKQVKTTKDCNAGRRRRISCRRRRREEVRNWRKKCKDRRLWNEILKKFKTHIALKRRLKKKKKK
jgi:hypothetical protein